MGDDSYVLGRCVPVLVNTNDGGSRQEFYYFATSAFAAERDARERGHNVMRSDVVGLESIVRGSNYFQGLEWASQQHGGEAAYLIYPTR